MSASSVSLRKRPSHSGPSKSRSKPARHKGLIVFVFCSHSLCCRVAKWSLWQRNNCFHMSRIKISFDYQ